ncbi:MAG: YbgC/FadM family acyl-CoA thioesterase [Campylobacterales bacterium]|nr:YbgC/FadM family acyl-CoA thioesterase [Campylobacterales bacterium]
MQIRVYYEDTDCGGIVYHTNYLKYCERARSELFFQNGVMPFLDSSGFVVANICAKFLKSAKLGDLLDVETVAIEIKNSYVVLNQKILNKYELLFEMDVRLAYIVCEKPSKIPDDFKTIFKELHV